MRVEDDSQDGIGLNCSVKIPRCLKVSSRVEDNDIEIIRKKIRMNKIFHTKFDPSIGNSEGSRYFEGVYNPNCESHVE